VISRGAALGLGFLVVALASLAMVTPLWYLASERRELFNALVLVSVSLALAAALFSRLRSRRKRRFPARPTNIP